MNHLFTLQNCLIVAGLGHFGILGASAMVPKVLNWKSALQGLPPFLRSLFWVYGIFIVLTIISFGTLTLLHSDAMARGEPVARSLAAVIAFFWGARLFVQFFIFDTRPYLTNVWLKIGNCVLTAAFIFLTITYGFAAFRA
jgi:hypothetical protein